MITSAQTAAITSVQTAAITFLPVNSFYYLDPVKLMAQLQPRPIRPPHHSCEHLRY